MAGGVAAPNTVPFAAFFTLPRRENAIVIGEAVLEA